ALLLSRSGHAPRPTYAVLPGRWAGYPPPMDRFLTCYAPVRHWSIAAPVRLACVKHAASVRPEPGSNSPMENSIQLMTEQLTINCPDRRSVQSLGATAEPATPQKGPHFPTSPNPSLVKEPASRRPVSSPAHKDT